MTKKDIRTETNKTKKRLPSGRMVEELDIDIGSPPIGDVEWLVWNKTKSEKPKAKAKVIAHTAFEARSKGMKLLGCGPDEIELEQAPQPPDSEATRATGPSKDFDPWKGLRENVKAGKRRRKT